MPEVDKRTFGNLPEPIHEEDADALSPFVLVELPILCRLVPIVIHYGVVPYWLLTVLDFGPEAKRLPARIYSPGPLWMRVLLRLARNNYKPLVGPTTLPETINVWKEYPGVYGQYIDRRKPDQLLKQNVFIVVRWPHWKNNRLTYAEILEDMRESGMAANLTLEALKKRVQRLGL